MHFARLFSFAGLTLLAVAASAGAGDVSVAPRHAFFDAASAATLRFRVAGDAPIDVRIRVVNRETGKVTRGWVRKRLGPGHSYEQRWSGIETGGVVAPEGAYRFVVSELGATRNIGAARFRFHPYLFPIAGPHAYRGGLGDFGAPRDGGRVHEGKDVWASCGEPLVALRGGKVQKRGYDPELYGNYVLIDARKTKTDFFYAHMLRPADVGGGERVRTGEGVGEVGTTGNASSVGCMLHLEAWPEGYRHGAPTDPEPMLREWDGWS